MILICLVLPVCFQMVTESVCLFPSNFDQLVRATDMYYFGLFIAEKTFCNKKQQKKQFCNSH